MKGRQKGRPTKWVEATIGQPISVGKPGMTFEIWQKWKKTTPSKLGTLVVSVGGLRWWAENAKKPVQCNWNHLADWFASKVH